MENNCVCQLHSLVAMINKAAVLAEAGQWEKATDILQGNAMPVLQQVTHTVWLNHHRSGTGEA